MRVVSGMLVDGSIQVSWATGQKASSQMDWGLDPDNMATTPEYHREPAEMVRYHTLYFPITYLDARHYFRVRSKTSNELVGQSPIYSVITPDDVKITSDNHLKSIVQLIITPIPTTDMITDTSIKNISTTDYEPTSFTQTAISEINTDSNISPHQGPTSSNYSTNPITTIL